CDSIIETGGVLARHKIILCVQALLLSLNFGYPIFAPYGESNQDKATVSGVVTLSGAEAGGIDIRHRGERGGVISGVVSGPAGSETIPVSVMLYGLPSGTEAASSFIQAGVARGFVFQGQPEGEYMIIARTFNEENNHSSAPRRITLRDSDVTGLELKLLPLGSISG